MNPRIQAREIYFYTVCLLALIVLTIGLVSLAENIVDLVNPATYITETQLLSYYREQYWGLSDEEIDMLVEEEIQNTLRFERNIALGGVLRGGIMVLFSVPVFIIHWKKAQALWHIKNKNSL